MPKTIVEINCSTVGSTGRIMFMIAKEARKAGFKVYTCSAVHGNEKKIEEQNHIYVILFASVWWELRRSDIVATMLHNLWIMPLIGLKVRGKKNGKV